VLSLSSSAIALRSPIPTRGVIAGLGMETGLDNLVALYLAGICGLGYGARQIVRALHEENVVIDTIVFSGGAGQSIQPWLYRCIRPVPERGALARRRSVGAGTVPWQGSHPCRREAQDVGG
jgi:hypothetical protein